MFEDLASKVAQSSKEYIKDNEFESFEELCRCYWGNSDDIKDEIDDILRKVSEGYIDEDDRSCICYKRDSISYHSFMKMLRKPVK